MTRPPLDLEAIRQRVEAARERPHDYIAHLADSVNALLGEAIRLTAENAALLAEVARLQGAMRHEASSLRERASFHPNKGYVDGLNFGAWTLENILGEADYGS